MKYLYTTLPILYEKEIKVIDKKLFASPYKGISSLFLAQSISGKIHSKLKAKSFKITYKEWSDKSACKDIALTKIHMYIAGVKEFKPFTVKGTGYIYKINYDKYKDHIKNLDWMDPDKEAIISGLDTIEYESVEKISADIEISPEEVIESVPLDKVKDMLIKNEFLEFERRYKKPVPSKIRPKFFTDALKYFSDLKKFKCYLIKNKGMVIVGKRSDLNSYEISEIYVEEKCRGQGIGSKLLEYVFKKYGDNNFLVEANANNTKGLALYHKFGFVELTTIDHKDGFTTVVLQRPGKFYSIKLNS